MVKRKKPTPDAAENDDGGRKTIRQAQPSRMRIFTVRCSLAEEGKEEYERESSPYLDGQFIIPNRILPGIRRQRESFKTFCAANIRLSKFLQACENNDAPRALEIVQSLLAGEFKGESEAGWNLPRSPQIMPPASTDGIALGATRAGSLEKDQASRSSRIWRTGSLYSISNEEKRNTQRELARTMLLVACRFNLVEVVQCILALHDSLISETELEYSAVHVASLYGSSEIITQVLREHEPKVDQPDALGCTPLHLMSLTGSIQAVEALLEMGADILAEDNEGRIPLYYAYIRRDRQICQLLWLNMSYIGDQLTSLRLSQCGMNFFPPRSVLSRFHKLEHLDVSNNSLHYLDPVIGTYEHLTSLEVSNNPLSALPPDFTSLSLPEQLQYLRFLKENQSDWNQRRVVVVGCPRVGKSALISALSVRSETAEAAFSFSSPASLGRKGFRTIRRSVMRNVSGIEKQDVSGFVSSGLRKGKSDVDDYLNYVSEPVELVGEKGTASVIFWEVNELQHATSLFLSGDVIFIVVYNLEELELLDLDGWMDAIQSTRRGDSPSPILFVGTHVSNPHCTTEHIEAVKETLLERYPRNRYKGLLPENFLTVDSITSAGIDETRDRITQFIQWPKYADRYFPPLQNGSWLILREYLRYQPFSFMLKEDLSHVLYACDIPKSELQASLRFLSSVTNVLHFPLSRGRHLLVLDLAWWASMINHLLDPKNPFLRQGGLLQHDELLQHFRQVTPDGIRDFISVMEEAQLVFPLRGELMISELLSSSKPEQLSTHWPTIAPAGFYECQRIYRYSQNAKGLFSYLQQEVLHSAEAHEFLVWRRGVVVQANHQQILITQSLVSQSYQIHIHVRYPATGQGSTCGMMLVICEILENLLRSSYAFCASSVVRLVPCVHCINLRALTGKPFLFSYDECYRAVTEGKPFLFCNYIESPSRCVRMDKLAPDLGFADIPQISEDLFTTGRLLGQGGFGSVHHGVLKGTKEIAIKELILQQQSSEQEQVATFSEFLREAFLMSFLQHPNLVSLYGVCLSRPPRLLMEFVPCGDLKELIVARKDQPLEPWLITQIAFDVALGMSHLHSISPPIIHRDLRSPNVFLVSLEHGASVSAKIADFGLSRMKSSAQIGERLNTYQWMAPETLGTTGAKVEYDEKADIYSYGMVLWEMLTRAFPFDEFITQRELTYINPAGKTVFNDEEVKAAIEQRRLRPTLPEEGPEELKLLIRQCWSHSPAKRPSFEAIVHRLAPLRHFSSSSDQSSHIARLTCAADLLRKNAALELDVANDIRCTKQFTIGAHVDEAPCTLLTVEKEKRLWIGCLNGCVMIFDLRNPQNPRRCASWQAHVNAILAMESSVSEADSDKETEVWLASADGSISVYPANSLDERRRIKKWSPSTSHISRIKVMKRIRQPSTGCETVWVVDAHGEVSVWDQSTYERVGTVKLERPEGVDAIAQHSDGTVWVGWQDSICLFDPESFELLSKFRAHPGACVTALVSVEDRVWSGASDGQMIVWQEAGTSVQAPLTVHSSKIFCLAVDNANMVWSGSFDKTIILWDCATLQPREELCDHSDSVKGLTPFFHQMWSISLDNTLRCWC